MSDEPKRIQWSARPDGFEPYYSEKHQVTMVCQWPVVDHDDQVRLEVAVSNEEERKAAEDLLHSIMLMPGFKIAIASHVFKAEAEEGASTDAGDSGPTEE